MLYQRYFLRMNQSSTTHILSLLLALMLSLAVVRIILIPIDVEKAPLKNPHRNPNNNNSSNRNANNVDANQNISTKFMLENTNISAVALHLIGLENDYHQNETENDANEKLKMVKTLKFNGIEYIDDAIQNRTQDAIEMNKIAANDGNNNSHSSRNHNKSIHENGKSNENVDDSKIRKRRTLNERKRHLKQRLLLHNDADLNVNKRRNMQFQRYAINLHV